MSQEANRPRSHVFSKRAQAERKDDNNPSPTPAKTRPVIYFPPSKRKKKRTHISLSPAIIIKKGIKDKKKKAVKLKKI